MFFGNNYFWKTYTIPQFFITSWAVAHLSNCIVPSMFTWYTKVLTIRLGEDGSGVYVGYLSFVGSLSRFVGPLISSLIIWMTDKGNYDTCDKKVTKL